MYAHNAIDDLNWYCDKLKSRRDLTDHINIVQKDIIPWIMSSQKFNISDVDGVMECFTKKYNKKTLYLGDLGGVRLPYNKIWLEYDIINEEITGLQCGTKHRAILAREIDNDVIQCVILAEIRLGGSLSKWSFSPLSYFISIDKPMAATAFYGASGSYDMIGEIDNSMNILASSYTSNFVLSGNQVEACYCLS